MQTNTYSTIQDLLTKAKHVVVSLGENPNLDSMAAGLALALSLERAGKNAQVLCPTVPSVTFGNLVGIQKVKRDKSTASTNGGLIISLPYKQGAIEKISYDIIGDRINLTVVPGLEGLGFTTDDIMYQTPQEGMDLMFAIGQPLEPYALDANGMIPLVNIDYNPANTRYGTVALIDERSSSHSEIVAQLFRELRLPIDADVAQNLFAGLVDATENFQSEYTTPAAFELAGFLLGKGAVRSRSAIAPSPLRDPFIAQEEAKVRAVPKTQLPSRDQRPGAPSWPHEVSRAKAFTNADQAGAKLPEDQKVSGAATAPKDWFEPKIYSGKTPVS